MRRSATIVGRRAIRAAVLASWAVMAILTAATTAEAGTGTGTGTGTTTGTTGADAVVTSVDAATGATATGSAAGRERNKSKKIDRDVPVVDLVRIDSDITLQKALEGSSAPDSVLMTLCLVEVEYLGFDGLPHKGQIIVKQELAGEIKEIFAEIQELKFPVESVIPIRFDKPDNGTSMDTLNNTYGFHYRAITTAKTTKLSNHSFGTAVDINPFQNPAVLKDGRVLPAGGKYDPKAEGTLTKDSPVVNIFLRRGWEWGGSWTSLKDYMHFEKK